MSCDAMKPAQPEDCWKIRGASISGKKGFVSDRRSMHNICRLDVQDDAFSWGLAQKYAQVMLKVGPLPWSDGVPSRPNFDLS